MTNTEQRQVTMDSTVKCPNCETPSCPLCISETGIVHFNRCRECGTDWTVDAITGETLGWLIPNDYATGDDAR